MPPPIQLPAAPDRVEALPGWAGRLIPALLDILGRISQTQAVQSISTAGRLHLTAGAELAAADFALSAGWGATATLAVAVGSTDPRGRVTVTANGAGIGVNPTVTLTFRDGAWIQSPFAQVGMSGGTGALLAPTWALTTTTLVITYPGTPVAGQTYTFEHQIVG